MLWTKVIVAVVLLVTSLGAALSMLTLMGRKEKSMSVGALKSVHRIAGWLTVLLALVNGYLGAKYIAMVGDGMSTRGALHGLVALGLLSALLIKLLIVKRFKQYLTMVPALGMIILALMLVVIGTSAGFYLVRAVCGPGASWLMETRESTVPVAATDGDEVVVASAESIAAGRQTYRAHCAGCHPTDPDANGYGPTLPGIFEREAILSSGTPITEESIRAQILSPGGTMPAFEGRLDDQEMDDLIAYMRTL